VSHIKNLTIFISYAEKLAVFDFSAPKIPLFMVEKWGVASLTKYALKA
jgi:hypothetical protein